MTGVVTAVSRSARHSFSKPNELFIRLVAGLGVEGDAHLGETVKHRSRVRVDPTQPNLRQVHLIHGELHDELRAAGFDVAAGEMGENVTTPRPGPARPARGRAAAPRRHGGGPGHRPAQPVRAAGPLSVRADGRAARLAPRTASLVRKAGIMSIVLTGGDVRPGDPIRVELPPEPHRSLGVV